MSFIDIYNTKIQLPELTNDISVEDWGESDIKEQYWRRRELPSFFELVEYDKEGNALLTEQQRIYAVEEVRRCKEGFWFMNNGEATYITGKHYFYLMWWKLEDDIYPEYRDTDRRYFLYLNHWENVPWCLGIIRGKKRREGATSQETSNLIYECIFFRNSFCGLVSKTEKDGKITFTNMVAFGYRQLPVFLKPKQLNNKDSVSELVFAHKSVTTRGEKGSVIDSDTGHRSRVDYRAPGKNSYDSGRLSRGLFDEGGKWDKENPFSTFIAIVMKTMVKGAKRVGFMVCPSTVNEMSKSGGEEYKKVWDSAEIKDDGRSVNRLVKYFTPAFDGFVGFIDKHGMSVIGEPNEDQYKYLVEKYVGVGDLTEADIKKGAAAYLLAIRESKEGSELEEEIRMNPFTEKEMFEAANTGCLFNSYKLNQRKNLLEIHQKELIERGNFMWENGIRDTKVVWCPDVNGRWQVVKEFMDEFNKEKTRLIDGGTKEEKYFESNATEKRGDSFFVPKNDWRFGGATDPYDHDVVEDNRRSNAASIIKQKLSPNGLNDKFSWCDICRYKARPATAELMYEDILMQHFFFSCKILPETQKPGIMRYFRNRGYAAFLMILPGYQEPGIPSTPENKQIGCEFTEYDVEVRTEKYYFIDIIDDLLGLDIKPGKSTKYDLGMAKIWTEVSCLNKMYERKPDNKVIDIASIFKQYKIKSA